MDVVSWPGQPFVSTQQDTQAVPTQTGADADHSFRLVEVRFQAPSTGNETAVPRSRLLPDSERRRHHVAALQRL